MKKWWIFPVRKMWVHQRVPPLNINGFHCGPTVNNPRPFCCRSHLPMACNLHHAHSVARWLVGDLFADHFDQPAATAGNATATPPAMVETQGFFAVVKPPGKRLRNYMERSTIYLMGKSTISMAIFNSYVKLPEGKPGLGLHHFYFSTPWRKPVGARRFIMYTYVGAIRRHWGGA